MSELEGKIKAGDAVKTLCFTRAVYGRVDFLDREGKNAYIKGRTQPGKPQVRHKVSVENLAKVTEDELAPEDRIGGELLLTEVVQQTTEELREGFENELNVATGGKREIVSREELGSGAFAIVDDKDLPPEELQRLQEEFRRRTTGDNRGEHVTDPWLNQPLDIKR